MLFTLLLAGFEFLIIAVGFTCGYYLLTTAAKETDWKRVLGIIFGWILIGNSLVVALMTHYQWIEHLQGNRPARVTKTGMACPIDKVMGSKGMMCNPGAETSRYKPIIVK